jgi:hypothetical protein
MIEEPIPVIDMKIPKRTLILQRSALCAGAFLAMASARTHAATSVYSQGFESDTAGWTDNVSDPGSGYGGITRVASGTNTITSQSGNFHAELTNVDSTGAYTNFGGYSGVWAGGYTSNISVYLNPALMGADGGFDYSVAMNNQSNTFLRDFVFHVTNDASTGSLLANVDNGSSDNPSTVLENQAGTVTLSAVGWYTLRSTMYDNSGALAVEMQILDPANAVVFDSTLSNPADLIATVVGGNRYGWFAALNTASPLAIDNVSLTSIPEPASMSLLAAGAFGILGLRRRRAGV